MRSRLTPEVHSDIVRLVTAGLGIEEAAVQVGIGRTTVNDWMRRGRSTEDEPYAQFAVDIERAVSTCEGVLLSRIQKAAAGGDWKAAAWIMERRFRRNWSTREGADAAHHHTTVAVLVRETGLPAEAIRRAMEDGRIPSEAIGQHPSGRRYIRDANLAKAALIAGESPSSAAADYPSHAAGDGVVDTTGEAVAEPPRSTVEQLERARLDRQRALAEKATLEVAQMRGEMLRRDEVQRALSNALTNMSSSLLQVAPRISAQLAKLNDPHEVAQLLDDEIRSRLTELAESLESLGSEQLDEKRGA